MYDLLDGDLQLIADFCGLDVLFILWKELPSLTLYISLKPLEAAKKRYIIKSHDGRNTKRLAKLLNCSEKFIYETLKQCTQKGGLTDAAK